MSALPKRTRALSKQEKPKEPMKTPSPEVLKALGKMLLESKTLIMFQCECGMFLAAQDDALLNTVIGNHRRRFCIFTKIV